MREVIYQAIIPLEPRTKKNSLVIKYRHSQGQNGVYKRIGGSVKYVGIPFISQSDIYKDYARECGYFLKRPQKPITERVNVRCIFYRQTRRMVDLNNLLAAATDILVDNGVLLDDNFNIIIGHDGSRVFIDNKNPRTEIYIERAEI